MSAALYDSFIADYYDESPLVRQRTRDIAFYVDAVREFGDPVLELGCGTGRVAMALAQLGKRVTGLDLSERMLVHGDMTKFELGEKFQLIIIPFRPFQHLLEVRDQVACLERVRAHLRPAGCLILDVFQTDAERIHDPIHMRESPLVEYWSHDGRQVRISERVAAFHRAEQRNDVEMIYAIEHPDGRKERLVFAWPLRYFFRYEVEHLLARCGFRVRAEYGDFDKTPIRDDSPEMIFVAQPGW